MPDEPNNRRADFDAQMKLPALHGYAEDATVIKRTGTVLSESSARVKALIQYVLEPWR